MHASRGPRRVVFASLEGWCAFALRNTTSPPAGVAMTGLDAWLLRWNATSGAGQVIDGFSLKKGLPPADASQDVALVSTVQAEGATVFTLTRAVATADAVYDVPFNVSGPNYISVVWTPTGSGSFAYHSATNKSSVLLDFFTRPVPSASATATATAAATATGTATSTSTATATTTASRSVTPSVTPSASTEPVAVVSASVVLRGISLAAAKAGGAVFNASIVRGVADVLRVPASTVRLVDLIFVPAVVRLRRAVEVAGHAISAASAAPCSEMKGRLVHRQPISPEMPAG